MSYVVLKWPGLYNLLNPQMHAALDKAGRLGVQCSPAVEADTEGADNGGSLLVTLPTAGQQAFLEDVGDISACLSANGLHSSSERISLSDWIKSQRLLQAVYKRPLKYKYTESSKRQ